MRRQVTPLHALQCAGLTVFAVRMLYMRHCHTFAQTRRCVGAWTSDCAKNLESCWPPILLVLIYSCRPLEKAISVKHASWLTGETSSVVSKKTPELEGSSSGLQPRPTLPGTPG